MEEIINWFINGRRPQFILYMEDDLNLFNTFFGVNWRRRQFLVSPSFSWAWHSSAPACLLVTLTSYLSNQLNFYENGRQPQFLWKWKTTSISLLTQRKTFLGECWPSKLQELEEDLNSFENEIQPQFLWKWKTTSFFWKKEDNPNFWQNWRWPQFQGKWKTT